MTACRQNRVLDSVSCTETTAFLFVFFISAFSYLHALLTGDPNTDISRLDHVDIICTIAWRHRLTKILIFRLYLNVSHIYFVITSSDTGDLNRRSSVV